MNDVVNTDDVNDVETLEHLSVFERKFVNNYVLNGNARESYKAAGYNSKGTDASVSSYANKLIYKPRISNAIKKRLLELDKSSQIQYESKRVELWDMAQTWRKTGDVRSGVAAVNEMNKMDGHHAAQNLNIRTETYSFGQMMDIPSDDTFESDVHKQPDEKPEKPEKSR